MVMTDIREFLLAQWTAEQSDVEDSRALSPGDLHWSMPSWLDRTRLLAEIAAKHQILKLHLPVVENVEWFDCPNNSGRAAVCTSCRPADPTTNWHPLPGEAGIRPEGFVPSYVLAPCPTLRLLASPYRGEADFNPSWEVTE